MKELNSVEVQEVSGAGLFSDAGTILGTGIGSIVDAQIGKGFAGIKAGALLGQGIGAIVDASLSFLTGLFGKK